MLRMLFEDFLERYESQASVLLEAKRDAVARDWNCHPAEITLMVEEINAVLAYEIVSGFGAEYPEYAKPDLQQLRLMRAVLDQWKGKIFLSQYPRDIEGIIGSFGYAIIAMDEKLNGKCPEVSRLKRDLRSALVFRDFEAVFATLGDQFHQAAMAVDEELHPLMVRDLVQMGRTCALHRQPKLYLPEIRSIANDNQPIAVEQAPGM